MDWLQTYRKHSHTIYFWLLALLAVSLPLSHFLIGLSQVLLGINWILEGNFKEKFKILKQRKGLIYFLGIYVVLLVWLCFTNDYSKALFELNIKFPFLQLPLIIATSKPLNNKQIKRILGFFVAAVTVAAIIVSLVIFEVIHKNFNNIREASIFIHHIRFGILMATSIIFMIYWIITNVVNKKWLYLLLILPIGWLLHTMVLLKTLTGIIILFSTLLILIIIYIRKVKSFYLKLIFAVYFIGMPIFIVTYIKNALNQYYYVDNVDFSKLPQYTQSGNPYWHDTTCHRIENGHFVMINICQKELKTEWNKRSELNYDSVDKRKQNLSSTLIRYMASKGLTKDSAGMSKLTATDINNVEKGLTNYIFAQKSSLYPKIYEVIWEIDEYQKTRNANKHSVTQRLVYYDITLYLIKSDLLFGTGTGDVKSTFSQYYQNHDTGLSTFSQNESHNQLLRFIVEFGLIGFLFLIFCFLYPPFAEKKWNSFYFLTIFIITFLSFINEDTLETQIGATMVSYFFSLFLFGSKADKEDEREKICC